MLSPAVIQKTKQITITNFKHLLKIKSVNLFGIAGFLIQQKRKDVRST